LYCEWDVCIKALIPDTGRGNGRDRDRDRGSDSGRGGKGKRDSKRRDTDIDGSGVAVINGKPLYVFITIVSSDDVTSDLTSKLASMWWLRLRLCVG
jgi:hypothetical protein